MYENIAKNFNYWPKKLSKIGYVYLAVVGAINLVISIFTGFDINVLVGLVFQIILVVWLYSIYRSQITLKKAYISKIMKKKYNYSDDQIEAALTQINEEVTHPVYEDRVTKNTFMITQNWVIGATGTACRAVAVRLNDIKDCERHIIKHHSKHGTSFSYCLKVIDYNDKAIMYRFGNTEKMDEATYELCEAMKNYVANTSQEPTESVSYESPEPYDEEAVRNEIIKMLKDGEMVQTIKYAREATGLGLKEAKEMVERIQLEVGLYK